MKQIADDGDSPKLKSKMKGAFTMVIVSWRAGGR
jgi:hypothetical protein